MTEPGKRTETARRTNLGRGLSALFGDDPADASALGPAESGRVSPSHLPIEFLHPGRFQPRRRFDQDEIDGLVTSIRERGILQPLLVRRDRDRSNSYEIICGERRWRAAQIAGLHEVPAIVRELSDTEALEISLIENIQRQDLTVLEEADGYRRLIDEFGHTQEDLARVVGKSRSHVANLMRLLALPEPVKAMVQDGTLSAGHARPLLTAKDPIRLAQEIIRRGLNVRQTEAYVKGEAETAPKTARGRATSTAAAKDQDLLDLEREISERLGLKVTVTPRGKSGTLTIEYQTLDQLDDVLRRLGG